MTELTLNLFDDGECASVQCLALLLSDEEEQYEKVSRKIWTRPWISKGKNEGVLITIFQELTKEGSDSFKGSF